MDVQEKYNLRFLNLKEIFDEAENNFSLKIIHVVDKDKDKIIEVKKLLKLPEKPLPFGEVIGLHYIGVKENGRARLVRCQAPNPCLLCKTGVNVFYKHFFYGIHKRRIVYMSVGQREGVKLAVAYEQFFARTTRSKSIKADLTDLNNMILFEFFASQNQQGDTVPRFSEIQIQRKEINNQHLIDDFNKLPPMRLLLEEKYPEIWNSEILEIIKNMD